MIDICIVGSGDVVRDRHASILRSLSNQIRVTGIVSTRQQAVNSVIDVLGYDVPQFVSIDDALNMRVDGALVAVSPSSTLDVATYLLRRGVPQYVEKPLAGDVISAAKFAEEVATLGVPVVVGENFQQQERFQRAKAIIDRFEYEDPTHVQIRDILRRGLRVNPRTDEGLFLEHFVHIVSSIRAVTGRSIQCINSNQSRIFGSLTEQTISATLQGGTVVEIQFGVSNTWSEDRYAFIFPDSDIKISHNYNHSTKKYTDVIEHWQGTDTLVGVETIHDADCGMAKCWAEFLSRIDSRDPSPSSSLLSAVNDLQVREAALLSREHAISVPITLLM